LPFGSCYHNQIDAQHDIGGYRACPIGMAGTGATLVRYVRAAADRPLALDAWAKGVHAAARHDSDGDEGDAPS